MNEKMASKDTKCFGTCILAFLTVFNFVTLLGIVIYHFYTPHQLATNGKTLLDEIKSEVHLNSRRSSSAGQENAFAEFLESQNSKLLDACRSTCKQEVVSVLKDAVEHIQPYTTDQHKRQINAAGNELANIFGEIAKSEIDILNQYCSNGSAICLPGQKGEPGIKGDTGLAGTLGLNGQKGDQGIKGDTGSPGTLGQMGPQGPKGEKGDSGGAGTLPPVPPTPFMSVTQTTDSCCVRLSAPEFPTQLEQIRVPEGTDLSLPCHPAGYPTPKVEWKWTPSAVLDTLRSAVNPEKLTINNAQAGDSRLYTCYVTNALGTAEKQYSVQVYPHINFEQRPSNYTVLTGSAVTFQCKVDGPLNPAVTWYKVINNANRIPLSQGVTSITHGSQLVVASATPASAGEYVCVGDNGVEKIETSSYLNLYGPPHIIPPGTVTVIKGQQAILKCDAIAFPPATITWSYPPGVTNAFINSDGSLVILNAQSKDATTYFCTATNKYGTDKDSVAVQVKVPAQVSVTPTIIPLGPGTTTIAVQCNPGGDPPLSISFAKDGQPVISDGHILTLPGNVLLVNSATQKDAGEYTCSVSNSVGGSQASAYAFKDVLGTIDCSATFSQCTDRVCGATCPRDCDRDNTAVFGLTQYSKDSSICKAGIQSGAISTNGGQFVWVNRGNMTSNAGGTQNGITGQALTVNPGDLTAVPVIIKP